jgi:hypothetical protein
MAKKDKQAKKDKSGGAAADGVDAIRSAIERTLESAGLTEKRQREVVEQVSAATGRIRQTLDDLRVVDEVREMRGQLETLAARVAELESGARTRVTGAARAATGSRATRTASSSGSSRTGSSTRSRSSTAAKPKSTSTRSASSTARKSTAKSTAKAPAKRASTSRSRAKPRGGSSSSS